ncbi:MFS transporter [Solihabitans fulvus]|uniref:MFS transporter n=1 Tax=Solihabitans fulvus TaxID=1892852 RepID=A0A5B2XDL7_9PSEU|nr:MFS transporter [Solihabitans fulvus]KAA2261316.1 MFS transporter [Solihabitans fulvus]
MGESRSVLKERNVQLYFSGLLLSYFGTTAMSLVVGVWVKTLTGSNSLAGLVGLCMWLPVPLAPAIGLVADRVRRRRLLVVTNLAMVAVLAPLLLVDGPAMLWLVFAVMTLYGVEGVLVTAAEPPLLTAMLPADQLTRINGLRMSLQEGMKLVAPAAGTALFLAWGAHPVVVLDAATFAAAGLATMSIRVAEPAPTRRTERWSTQVAEGLRYLVGQPVLRRMMIGSPVAMFVAGVAGTAGWALVDQGMHRAPTFMGVLAPVQGAGSVVAGLLAATLARRIGTARLVGVGMAIVAGGVAFRVFPTLPTVLAGTVCNGVGLVWVIIGALTLVQQITPNELLGRTSATMSTLVYGGTPVGIALGSGLAGVLDFRVIFGALAVLAGGAAALLLRRAGTPAEPVPA